jgi:hypothetical protein
MKNRVRGQINRRAEGQRERAFARPPEPDYGDDALGLQPNVRPTRRRRVKRAKGKRRTPS